MEILRLTVDDGPRLRAIRLRALHEAPYAFGSTYEACVLWPDEVWTRQLSELVTFVAVMDGQDVGMVRGEVDAELAGAAVLRSMWVAPEARGRGAGDALIGAIVHWARDAGLQRLWLDVMDDNAAAVALYTRHGFEPTGATSTLPPPREHVREHQRARAL